MADWTAPPFPGPPALGRGAVIAAGGEVPAGFEDALYVRIDDEVLEEPRHAADVLHRAWARREPYVVELAIPNEALRAPESQHQPPYELPADFGFDRERLFFLVWANTYDCRAGAPAWHLATHYAKAAGALPPTDRDVRLRDGTSVWVDGGPRGPIPGFDEPLVHRESVTLLGRLTPLRYQPPSADLAPDQLAAVSHPAGPARILAPAGSGKTRVLTERLRHLLHDRDVEPGLVTAVAYNTRAADEMRQRTPDVEANVRTLHSLAFRICNQVERREVIHERDVRSILDKLVRTARIPNQDPYQPYLEALGEVRLGLRDPKDVEAERDDVDGFADLFPRFREELARRRATDFDDQIYRAIELLLQRPDLRAKVQRSCTHLLVDEFQDLTPAFLLLVRLVASPSLQVFGVGDDDQVIYGYAGASPDFLIGYEQLFPGADVYALEVNYRCPPVVVEQAATLLGHNRRRVAKDIRSGPGRERVETAAAVHQVDAGAMAERAAEVVRGWLDDGADPAQVAVLARVNSALLPAQVTFTHAAIPHNAPLDENVLRRTGIRSALAWLRLGLDPERMYRDDLFETLRRPSRKLVTKLNDPLRSRGRWTLTGLYDLANMLDGTAKQRLTGYCDDIAHLTAAITEGADTARALWIIRHRIGLDEAVQALDASKSKPEGSSHGDDLDALEQLAALHTDPVTFRDWLVEQLQVPGTDQGVLLSTIHRVKGMEWDRVLVFAANDGLFPHRLADDTEEERRIFHVAVTRCREEVAVIANREAPSPFVADLTTVAPEPREDEPSRPARRRPTQPTLAPARGAAGDDEDEEVVAEVGVELTLAGGFSGEIAEIVDDAVVVRTPRGSTLRVRFGERVRIDGRPRTLVSAVAAEDEQLDADDPVVEARFEALRSWRLERARADGVPPYVVLHDSHLRTIAQRNPGSLVALADCPGIGPTKLDRYGDDVLATLEDATA